MSQKLRKAQMFSSDFLVACSIFLLSLVIIMVYWSYTNIQIEETRNFNDMVDKAYIISQIWFRDGTPEYWNPSSIIELGLINEHRLNETKMNQMKNMGYNKVKGIIGAAPYDFRFSVRLIGDTPIIPPVAYLMGEAHTASNSKINILGQLNESNIVWDFYQADNIPPTDSYNAINHYVDIGQPERLMAKIIQNIDNYNSIILEHPKLRCSNPNNPSTCSGLNSNNQTILKNWLNNSKHSLFYINKWETFLNIFGITPMGVSYNPPTVFVNSTDPILKNANIGEIIEFQQDAGPFSNIAPPYLMKTIMYEQGNPTECMFCRWWFGNGTIYYIGDTTRNDGGTPRIISGLEPLGYNFIFGKYPTKAKNIIKVQRAGVLNNSIAVIEVLLWA